MTLHTFSSMSQPADFQSNQQHCISIWLQNVRNMWRTVDTDKFNFYFQLCNTELNVMLITELTEELI